jgi:uncharacterized membrane protein YgdD (TMEM256/DUF423 family)
VTAPRWVKVAGMLGFAGVALGAFGAHALSSRVPPERLATWNTAVLYHLLHAVALLAVAVAGRWDIRWPARLWLTGILLFSGSLYALVLTGITRLALITPVGGLCLLAGWGAVLWLKPAVLGGMPVACDGPARVKSSQQGSDHPFATDVPER